MNAHLACIGGEDHAPRLPFPLALKDRGFRVTAVSTASGEPFAAAGIAHVAYSCDRFSSRWSKWRSVAELRRILDRLQPDIVQSFDTKPNLLAPLAARGRYPTVRTINGLGWLFSSGEPRALALRPIYCGLQGLVSRWTSPTVSDRARRRARRDAHRSDLEIPSGRQRGPLRDPWSALMIQFWCDMADRPTPATNPPARMFKLLGD